MLQVSVAATYFEFPCAPSGILHHHNFSISKYIKRLTQYRYNHQIKQWLVANKFVLYDQRTELCRLPINDLPHFISTLKLSNIEVNLVDNKPDPGSVVDIPLNEDWHDKPGQTEAIAYLADDSRRMRGLSLQTGCLVGDTQITVAQDCLQYTITMKDAYARFGNIEELQLSTLSFTGECIELNPVYQVVYSGKQIVFKVTLANGRSIEGTYDHPIMTDQGYVKLVQLIDKQVMCEYGYSVGYAAVTSIVCTGLKDTYDIKCYGPYHNFVANGIVSSNSGKTFCTIKAISKLKRRAIIFVNGLLDQWVKCLLEQTDLLPDDIYLIQGHASIGKLCELLKTYKPTIYVASISTVRKHILTKEPPYTTYHEFSKLLRLADIGTKVTDETHLNFAANATIDLTVNVANNIYLSATYTRSDDEEKKIFDIIYPAAMRFGEDQYKRYVNITQYNYNIGNIPRGAVQTPQGYNQPKYEKFLLKKVSTSHAYFNSVIAPIISSHYINKMTLGQKLLILAGTRNMCEFIRDECISKYSYYNFNVELYMAETAEEVLTSADIIVSTTGSLGTGKDVSNLRTVILTNSFSSTGLCKQVLGRLRELPGCVPEFVYICNTGIQAHLSHARHRRELYKQLGLTFKEVSI